MSKIILEEQAAPDTPASNKVVIYPKADGGLYKKDDTGEEKQLDSSDSDTFKETQAYTESPMIVSGGEVTEGTNAGTFKVAALTALLRTTDSLTGELEKVTKTVEDNISITTADTTYFVCLNYNGGSPTISLSTSNPYDADKRNIPIGKVSKDSSDNVRYISGGFRFQDGVEKLHRRAKELRELELERGSTISYLATDKFTMETGVAYGGLNRYPLSAYNSDTTQFTMIYSDGGTGWTETDRNTIDCSHYDDGSGTLATIGNNKYGCHYVYKHIDDDHVYVVLGTGSYSLAEAVTNSVIPPERPDHLNDFGCLIGCIIAPKNGGEFTKVVMITSQFFSGEEVANHANLSNLDYASSGHTGFAKSGTNDDITSMTGLNNYGIPGVKIANSVVTKTTTATLTVAEAGLVLVSASSAYTITLPTAVGNTGLTYHFIKTDANYNCITLDGDGTETFNYENADGVPKETYARLNTYCAEVTVVSDGSNWQVINEKLGQVPEAHAYSISGQENITGNTWVKVNLDGKVYDIGSNFNTTDSKFTCPIAGTYQVIAQVTWDIADFVADKEYKMAVYKNGSGDIYTSNSSSLAVFLPNNINYIKSFAKDDYLQVFVKYVDAASTQDILSDAGKTDIVVRLISKD